MKKPIFAAFSRLRFFGGAVALLVTALPAVLAAQTEVVNIYSARHYPGDELLYAGFTKATSIKINRVDSDDASIVQRLKAEGAGSPADVILLVDAARLWSAEAAGLFKPVKSNLLDAAIPAHLSGKVRPEGTPWFGFSTRARIVVYDKSRVKREDVDTYEKLAAPVNKGLVCTRSGSHPYNLSLFGAMVLHMGEKATEAWLKGIVANAARAPKGGDVDQIRSVAAGECGIAITNSYYLARIMRSSVASERDLAEKLGVVFPNQSSWGTHVNISGGGMAKHAKNSANAVKFLEYLASNEAQNYFANGNNEWPAARGVPINNAALQAMTGGSFKAETIPISEVGMNQAVVQQMLDRVGYK